MNFKLNDSQSFYPWYEVLTAFFLIFHFSKLDRKSYFFHFIILLFQVQKKPLTYWNGYVVPFSDEYALLLMISQEVSEGDRLSYQSYISLLWSAGSSSSAVRLLWYSAHLPWAWSCISLSSSPPILSWFFFIFLWRKKRSFKRHLGKDAFPSFSQIFSQI